MSDEVEILEKALNNKDESAMVTITLNHSNYQRVKLREKYKSKVRKDLIDDIEKKMSGDLKNAISA